MYLRIELEAIEFRGGHVLEDFQYFQDGIAVNQVL